MARAVSLHALAQFKGPLLNAPDLAELARKLAVYGCALALIAAGSALPF